MKTNLFKVPQISQRVGFGLIALFLILAGLFTRYTDLSTPLLDFHPTRQLFGAIKARGYYIQQDPTIPDWQKEIARRQLRTEAIIEPPLLESASAYLYSQFGENTAYPRAISATAWLLGAFFLYKLSKNLTDSSFGSLVAVSVYLLLPFGVMASRAFQPDPIMILLLIIFWWAFENWCRQKGWRWAFMAGLTGGLTIFVKFTAVFFVVIVAIGFLLANNKSSTIFKKTQFWIATLLGILPAGLYFFYGYFVDPFLKSQMNDRFFISQWIDPYFFLRWIMTADNVIPIALGLVGVIGGFLMSDRRNRIIFTSMAVAYILFGFTFAHHISSHDYYSLPLIPIFSLYIGNIASKLLPSLGLDDHPESNLNSGLITVIVTAILLGTVTQVVNLKNNNYTTEKATWVEIGQVIGHQPGLISLTTDYGYPLEYYGWQNTELWPASTEYKKLDKEFAKLANKKSYFLITDFVELANQPDLLTLLRDRFPVIAEKNSYILFDLTKPLQ